MKNIKENVKIIFNTIELDSTLTSDTKEFIKSLRRYFNKKKHLSDRQFSCLLEIFNYQTQKKAEKVKKQKSLL